MKLEPDVSRSSVRRLVEERGLTQPPDVSRSSVRRLVEERGLTQPPIRFES